MFPNEIWLRVVVHALPAGLRALYSVSGDLRVMVVRRAKELTESEILEADVPVIKAPTEYWIAPNKLDVILERASWCNSLRVMESLLKSFLGTDSRMMYKWRFMENALWVLEHERWCRSMCKQGLIVIEFLPHKEGHLREYRINGDWVCVEPGSRHARYPKRRRVAYYQFY